MNAVDEMKNIFMSVLYIEMKYINKSRYLTQKTSRYISWVLQERPNPEIRLDKAEWSYLCSFVTF